MKAFLKFSAVIALAVTVLAFILMLACPGVVSGDNSISGAKAIFGWKSSGWLSTSAKGAAVGIVAFILVLIAMITLALVSATAFVKIKAIEKYTSLMAMVSAALLVVAGVLSFFVCANFISANGLNSLKEYYSLGAGMIISGILYILAGVIAAFPAIAKLVK